MNETVRNILVGTVVVLVAAVAFPPYALTLPNGAYPFRGFKPIWTLGDIIEKNVVKPTVESKKLPTGKTLLYLGEPKTVVERTPTYFAIYVPVLFAEMLVILAGGTMFAFICWQRPRPGQ